MACWGCVRGAQTEWVSALVLSSQGGISPPAAFPWQVAALWLTLWVVGITYTAFVLMYWCLASSILRKRLSFYRSQTLGRILIFLYLLQCIREIKKALSPCRWVSTCANVNAQRTPSPQKPKPIINFHLCLWALLQSRWITRILAESLTDTNTWLSLAFLLNLIKDIVY